MKETPVNRNARGKYQVRGRRNIELDLGDHDPALFAVIEKEMETNLPTSYDGITIEWVNSFGVRHRGRDGKLGGYANVPYTVVMDALPVGKRLFAYYGGQVHEITFQTEGNQTRASLAIGDPPIGLGP